jgi:hypothetical protein
MKLLVIMDGNGHFHVSHPTDRKATIDMLWRIHDGDFMADEISRGLRLKKDLSEYCCKEWDELINTLTCRGTLEYVEISDIIPIGCKCEQEKKS